MSEEIVTLVTGGNRGMGLEISRELLQKGQRVIIGSRNLEKGQDTVNELAQEGLKADLVQLDVTDHNSVESAAKSIQDKYGYLSVLINNAGAVFDFRQEPSVVEMDRLHKDFEINYFGLIDVTQQLMPLLQQSKQAKIINISSMMGSKTEALNPESQVYQAVAVGYQSAKAAANMYTVQLAKEMQKKNLNITVNAVDPGMVATEFGGATPDQAKAMGAKPIEEGVSRTVELATDENNDVTATFSNADGPVGW
ncbi:SDR family NAD(P)-dependent oxidoreductase [Pediococcus argentinicus]|uniref:Carbonyl reductase n=1 Tax=Pediococcus argentinicus TaxID=480391 RepID=A0A0R2NGD4_9LACO|nr:SDR family NAD(P)-dependent oxidoreductase [Pediococcus argentinicus]KRO24897.1 carbonyl reductase [Pediococcus argentinicus]NKZ22595.1 SDR family NAD(P)-dependent oxidoreductase [Pediococcus argentinicus]GEP19745.1 carbonyl reductase [Pediococcus argentinicus]